MVKQLNVSANHPLLLNNLKAQNSPAKYLGASISIVDGFGEKGAKARPFRQELSLKQFCSWFYAAILGNAQAFSTVPLRLYVRKRKGRKMSHEFRDEREYTKAVEDGSACSFRTRKVRRKTMDYLRGRAANKPSNTVIRKAASFGDEYEEVMDSHPATALLDNPNPWQDGPSMAVLRSIYLQTTGNAYVHPVIDKSLGIPSELWIMPSQWTKIIPDREMFIKGYTYGRTKADLVQLADDEVIQWKLPNPNDLHYGMGRVEAAWTVLGLQNAKRTQDTAVYDNGSRPDWMLVVKQGGSSESLDRLEEAVESKLRGPKGAGKFLTVTGDVDAIPLNFDPTEIGDPDKIVQEIAAITGYPLYKLLGNDPIKANSGIQDAAWLRDTIQHLCSVDEGPLNSRYLPLFGIQEDAFLAYDNPVPENEAEDGDQIRKNVAGSLSTVNEGRALMGDEPVDGGDVILIPSSMVPLTMAGQNMGTTTTDPAKPTKAMRRAELARAL